MSPMSPTSVVHQGAVKLHRRGVFDSRYFVLLKDRILYYKTQQHFSKGMQNSGCIALADLQRLEVKGDKIVLHLVSLELVLSTDEQAELAHWAELLEQTARALRGRVEEAGDEVEVTERDVTRAERQAEEKVNARMVADQREEDEVVEVARQPPIAAPPEPSGRAGAISLNPPHVANAAIDSGPQGDDDGAMWDDFEEVSIPSGPTAALARSQRINPQPPLLVATSPASSSSFAPPPRGAGKPGKAGGSETGMTLYKVFATCNKNSNGRIDKKELVRVCKFRQDIAVFFGLPLSNRQPGGVSNAVEQFFARMDVTNEAAISWQELKAWYGRVTQKKPQPQRNARQPIDQQASPSPPPKHNSFAPLRSHSVESLQRQPSREPATRLFPSRTLSQTAAREAPSRRGAATPPPAARRLPVGHTSPPPPQAMPIATPFSEAKMQRAGPSPTVAPSASTCSTSYEPTPRRDLVPRCAASIPERHRSPEPRRRASYFTERAHTMEQTNSKEKAFLSGLQYPEILHGEDAIVATSRRRHSISHKLNYPRLLFPDGDPGATEKITGAHEARVVSPARRSCAWQKIVHVDGQMPCEVTRGRYAEPPVTGKITAVRALVDPHGGPPSTGMLSGKVPAQR